MSRPPDAGLTPGLTPLRLTAPRAAEQLDTIAEAAATRPTLARCLRRLSAFLRESPGSQTHFPLLETARAAYPQHPDPVGAFRELRRSAARFAGEHGLALVIGVDGHKRLDPAERTCWFEGSDNLDERLREISSASAVTPQDASPPIPARGHPERPRVRIYYDIAPRDRKAADGFVSELNLLLATDRDYWIEPLPQPVLGMDEDSERRRAVSMADLVVVLLSPAYLSWVASRGHVASMVASSPPVASVRWSALSDRQDLGPYAGIAVFPSTGDTDAPLYLSGLRRPRLGRTLSQLHRRLIEVIEARRSTRATPAAWPGSGEPEGPLESLAHRLAALDEPAVIARSARRTILDKGIGEASPAPGVSPESVEVQAYLVEWATVPGRPYFVIFGEYGMGKTVAAQALTSELFRRRDAGEDAPLPIYFDLRRLSHGVRSRDATLSELLDDLIARAWRAGSGRSAVTAGDVITAVQERGALVIFDGLDEVLVHLTEHQGQCLLRELLGILPPGMVARDGARPQAGRVLLTCRTHFFRTVREQHTFFRGEDRDRLAPELYDALHLLPFDESQIRAYLAQHQGAVGVDRALQLIQSVHDLAGLAGRPYSLSLIADQIERLEQRVASGRPIDAASLYEELVQSWLDRDAGKHQLERDHKVRLMEDLAVHLWRNGLRRVPVGDLEVWLRGRLAEDVDLARWVALARPDPARLAEDLRTATFIVRPGADRFEFAHTSLLEYFLARFLHRELRLGNAEAWALPAPSPETLDFLVDLVRATETEACFANLGRWGRSYRPLLSELALRFCFRAAERGGPLPSLRGFDLTGANLRGLTVAPAGGALNMAGSRLVGADLREISWSAVNLSGSDLRGARLMRGELHRCDLRSTQMAGADLSGAIVRGCNLANVDLEQAHLQDSQWLWCTPATMTVALPASQVAPPPGGSPVVSTDARLEVFAGHEGAVLSMAWSPDGRYLASAGQEGLVCVWKIESGAEIMHLHHWRMVHAVAWSPDGRRLAAGGGDGVQLWDPEDPAAGPTMLGGSRSVWAVAWSPDGRRLAVAGRDGVQVWDPVDPATEPTVLGGGRFVQAVAWSPDGRRLAAGGRDGVQVWDADDPTARPTMLRRRSRLVQALAWSPDGRRLAAGYHGVQVWDPEDPSTKPTMLQGGSRPVHAVAWSPDGRRLAAAGDGVQVWDADDPATKPATLGGSSIVWAVAWSPDGRRLAAAGYGLVSIWDPDDSSTEPTVLGGGGRFVHAVAWSPDGQRLAAAGYGFVGIWDPGDSSTKPTMAPEGNRQVQALAWSPDARRLAAAGYSSISIWVIGDSSTKPPVLPRWSRTVHAVAWSPNAQRLATAGQDGVQVWDLADPATEPTMLPGVGRFIQALAWSPDARRLAAAGSGSVGIWDLVDLATEPTVLRGADRSVEALAWSPDGRRLAAGASEGVQVWDLADPGTEPTRLGGGGRFVQALAWSPDAQRLAAGGQDGVSIWEPNGPATEPTRLRGVGRLVRAVAWSPDGRRLASGNDGGAVHVAQLSPGGPGVTLQYLPRGAWAILNDGGQAPVLCGGDAWRWLRWVRTDAGKGEPAIYPAEYFGPLPGIGAT